MCKAGIVIYYFVCRINIELSLSKLIEFATHRTYNHEKRYIDFESFLLGEVQAYLTVLGIFIPNSVFRDFIPSGVSIRCTCLQTPCCSLPLDREHLSLIRYCPLRASFALFRNQLEIDRHKTCPPRQRFHCVGMASGNLANNAER